MKKTASIIKKRIIHPEDFEGKRFKPSVQTKTGFTKLFTSIYTEFSKTIRIKSLEWNREEFELMIVEESSGEIMHLYLRDNTPDKKCGGVLCTHNICTGVHQEISNQHFLKFIVYFLARGQELTIGSFMKILCNDIKAKKEYYQTFWRASRPPLSIIQDWGHPLHKFRYIAHEGVFRNLDQSISLNLPEASIHHSERECQGISPNNKEKGYHFFNFPGGYYDHTFDKYYYLTPEERKYYLEGKNLGYGMGYSSDLDENDIVMGEGTDKLIKILKEVEANAEKGNIKLVSFNCCCVPRIIGDDIHSVLKRAKEKLDIPFIFQGQLEKTPYEQKIILLKSYLKDIDIENIKKTPQSISLFGFHENKYQKCLGDMLFDSGVKINTSFIPSIDVRLLPLMYKSELFVFSPNNFQKEVFEDPFQEIGTDLIMPKYPYGFQNSINWIELILSKFDIQLQVNLVQKQEDKFKHGVKRIQAKKYTLGIVCMGKQDVAKLLNPDYMNNIDIIEVLLEMGFGVNLYIYDNFKGFTNNSDDSYSLSDGDHTAIDKLIFDRFMLKGKEIYPNINYFDGLDSFNSLVDKHKINALYSDIYFDDRIVQNGLPQFNLKHFFAGFEGAIETLEGFERLCEANIYKDYAQYL